VGGVRAPTGQPDSSIAPQAPNPSNVLGVFGLSIRTQERDLDEEFSRFGRVEKVTIVYDQRVSLRIPLIVQLLTTAF
jgi:transformer-2 protein